MIFPRAHFLQGRQQMKVMLVTFAFFLIIDNLMVHQPVPYSVICNDQWYQALENQFFITQPSKTYFSFLNVFFWTKMTGLKRRAVEE